MKRIPIITVLFLLLVCSDVLIGQVAIAASPQKKCGPSDKVEAKVSNVVCNTKANNLTFDLTVTNAGVPHTTVGSGFSILRITSPNPSIYSLGSNNTLNKFSVTTSLGSGCPAITDYFVNFQSPIICEPSLQLATVAAPVPTLSQWSLVVLGFLLLIVGVVAMNNKRLVNT
ncbi:MAG: IPTL-CTERM sorting domain-containing protein [Saprospiraceae bacterium]